MSGYKGRENFDPPIGLNNNYRNPRKIIPNQNIKKRNKPIKKFQEIAKISAMISVNQTLAIKRLIHDLEEIKNPENCVVGVSATPLQDSMFEWHANIKAMTNNAYKGCILHLSLIFPKNYPLYPPQIKILSEPSLPHPNIIGCYLCLDMLQYPSTNKINHWTSAYTVLSILIQLQSFFFDVEDNYFTNSIENEIRKTVVSINMNSCRHTDCKHKGSASPYPEFPSVKKDSFILYPEKLLKAVKNEIICYHRKTSFEINPLGVLINVVKLPRTGQIKGILPSMDFLSLKSYVKDNIRVDILKKKYKLWFPFYFGYKEDQILYLTTKTISMIMNDNTKGFSPDLVLKVMPKFFTYLIVDIISEKIHISSRALRILIYIFRSLIMLLKNFPQVKEEVDKNIEKFLTSEKNRNKENTPSLGEFLVLICLSEKYKIEDVIYQYLDEQLDRQILWIIQALPEIEDLMQTNKLDDIKSKVCFKAGITGNQLILFYYHFLKRILYRNMYGLDEIARRLDLNYGNISDNEIDSNQKVIREILNIDSYHEFYKFLNLPVPSTSEMNERIKIAFKHSLDKGYHGNDLVRCVPDRKTQVKMLLDKLKPIGELVNETGELIDENNDIWEKLVKEKFDQMVRLKYKLREERIVPSIAIKYYEEVKHEYTSTSNLEIIKDKLHLLPYLYVENSREDKLFEKLSWRQIYIKIYLETYVKFFRFTGDFRELYSILDKVNSQIIHFNLFIYNPSILKSNFNFIRVILSKLTNLKHLNLYYIDACDIKTLKNINKGVNNFVNTNGSLEGLKVYVTKSLNFFSSKDYNILTLLDKLAGLKSLDLSGITLDLNSSLRLRNHLYHHKTIEHLNISSCMINDEMAKEIADGIMKAKALESIYLRGNRFRVGLANLLYNLSFQPNIKVVDISDNEFADNKETSNALYKLLKMSQTLDTLISTNNKFLINNLTIEFYKSIGDNSSIRYIDLSNSGNFNITQIGYFGMAIAFNHLKKGSLQTILLKSTSISYHILCSMIDNMSISEHDHFTWYGCNFDNSVIKDSKEYFQKKMYSNVKHFDLKSNFMNTNININDLKQTNKNHLNVLFENSPIQSLNISKCYINKNFVSMLGKALTKTNNIKSLIMSESDLNGESIKHFFSILFDSQIKSENSPKLNSNVKLEVLDLSKNCMGYNGIEALTTFIKVSDNIRLLNIFHNFFGVEGARSLSKALAVNKTLNYLDIGFNRIKNLGFCEIINALVSNPNSELKFLGSRFNLLDNKDNITELELSKVFNNQACKLENIEISNNLYDEKSTYTIFNNQYLMATNKVNLDIFETLYFLIPERLERTICITSLDENISRFDIYKSLSQAETNSVEKDKSLIGIPNFISLKRERNTDSRKEAKRNNVFVEFIHPNSVNKILQIDCTEGFNIGLNKVKVYKAGTKSEKNPSRRKKLRIFQKNKKSKFSA